MIIPASAVFQEAAYFADHGFIALRLKCDRQRECFFEAKAKVGAGMLPGNSPDHGGSACDSTLTSAFPPTTPIGGNHSGSTVDYCSTTPHPGCIGNVINGPAFMGVAAGDFRLRRDSPCIDAGTNLAGLISTNILSFPSSHGRQQRRRGPVRH